MKRFSLKGFFTRLNEELNFMRWIDFKYEVPQLHIAFFYRWVSIMHLVVERKLKENDEDRWEIVVSFIRASLLTTNLTTKSFRFACCVSSRAVYRSVVEKPQSIRVVWVCHDRKKTFVIDFLSEYKFCECPQNQMTKEIKEVFLFSEKSQEVN